MWHILKKIVEELEQKAATSQNRSDILISDLFKAEIYNGWQKAFKDNYAESLKNSDLLGAWELLLLLNLSLPMLGLGLISL